MTFGCSPGLMVTHGLTVESVGVWVLQDQLNTTLDLDPVAPRGERYFVTHQYFISAMAWMNSLVNIKEAIRSRG